MRGISISLFVSVAIASHPQQPVDAIQFGFLTQLVENCLVKSSSGNKKVAQFSSFLPSNSLESTSSPTSFLKIRGGGTVSKFAKYIGDSRSRCWIVLLLSILTDTCSTTMMKMGRDEGSAAKLLTAYFGFFLR